MSLDLYSVTVMTSVVAAVAGVTFIVETIIRRDTGPGRLWAGSFLCGIATTVAYLAWSADIGGAVAIAVGNALFVLVAGLMWLGNRQFNDRPLGAATAVSLALSVVAFVAVFVEYPAQGEWSGWVVLAASVLALFVAAGVEALRAPMREIRTTWALAMVLLLAGLVYGVRLVALLFVGYDDPLFTDVLGTLAAHFATIVLTIVVAIVASVLRAQRSADYRYEWLTEGGVAADGIMLSRTLARAGADMIDRAAWRSEGVVAIVVRVEGVSRLRTAFGRDAADAVVRALRLSTRRYSPASALVGEDVEGGLAVFAVAATAADARRLGATIYRGCTEELATATPGLFPDVGVGIAFSEDVGYDLPRLLEGARSAARRATETPGASVLFDTPAAS